MIANRGCVKICHFDTAPCKCRHMVRDNRLFYFFGILVLEVIVYFPEP